MRRAIDDDGRVAVLTDPDDDAIGRALARGPVVVLSNRPAIAPRLARAATAAWALLPLDVAPATLDAVVDTVAAGFAVLPARQATAAVEDLRDQRDPGGLEPLPEPLTPRERDVLQRLAEGLPNRAIAEALGISDHTVKFHLAAIFGKLGAGTRTEAARIGMRRGLVTL
jgi:DNA-binding NarL/FixJ family response regulator